MEQMLAEFEAELAGILNWALHGCLDWQRHGLGEPPEVRIATADNRDEMDTLGAFLAECCLLRPDARVSSHGFRKQHTRGPGMARPWPGVCAGFAYLMDRVKDVKG